MLSTMVAVIPPCRVPWRFECSWLTVISATHFPFSADIILIYININIVYKIFIAICLLHTYLIVWIFYIYIYQAIKIECLPSFVRFINFAKMKQIILLYNIITCQFWFFSHFDLIHNFCFPIERMKPWQKLSQILVNYKSYSILFQAFWKEKE